MDFEELWRRIQGRRARKTLSISIPNDRVNGEELAGPLDPHNLGYFQIRLAEMFLRDERVLWNEWAPATLFLCEFKYGNESVRSPFFVSNQLLQGLEAAGQGLGKTGVRFRNTRVVGPVPYAGDEIAVFAGLFRTKIVDLRKSLFAVFDKLFGVVDVAGLGAYLKLAEKLSDEVLKSFGMSDIECMLAERNVFGTPTQAMRDGYFVMLNVDERELDAATLYVSNGMLQRKNGDKLIPFDVCDYCLLRIETMQTRNDYTTLPFDKYFKDAVGLLPEGKVAEGRALLIKCLNAVVTSNDLSQDHKYRLTEFYQIAFFKDQERYARLRAEPVGDASRGSRKGGHPDDVTAELEIKRLRGRIDAHPELRRTKAALDQIESQLTSDGVETATDDGVDREANIVRYLARPCNPPLAGRDRISANELVTALTIGTMAG